MPTYDQIQELIDNCSTEWTQRNGVNGRLVTGPNGNTIFLPAAGWRYRDYPPTEAGSFGGYWSRTLCTRRPDLAYFLFFDDSVNWRIWDDCRPEAFTVRAVRVPLNF